MNNQKRVVSALLVMGLLLLTSCGGGEPASNASSTVAPSPAASTASSEAAAPTLQVPENMNQTGLPIAKTPVTYNAVVVTGNTDLDFNSSELLTLWAKETNVNFKFETIPTGNTEKLKLKFASRTFPDVMFRTDLPKTILYEAALSGDILPLNDMLASYAPNWSKYLETTPSSKSRISYLDGNIYSLPYVGELTPALGLRDQWFINVAWLKELNIPVPTSFDAYVAALKAIRDNAGKGSIPKEVIPWYFQWDGYTAGCFEMFGAHGVFVPDDNYEIVVDGKIVSQAVNPEIKKVLKSFQMMYNEKLIPAEAFTDTDWAAYATKANSNPPILGAYAGFGYNGANTREDGTLNFDRMHLPKTADAARVYMREQINAAVRENQFTIFKDAKDPEILVRWVDYLAEADNSVMNTYDLETSGNWSRDGERYNIVKASLVTPHVDFPSMVSFALSDRFNFDPESGDFKRLEAVEFYKNEMAPKEMYVPALSYDEKETDVLSRYETDLKNFRKTTFVQWITTNADIDKEWDGFVAKCKDMKLDEVLGARQSAYDRYMSAK